MSVSNYANPMSWEGEIAVATGLLGLGKLIPSYVPVGTTKLIVGMAAPCGIDSSYTSDVDCIKSCCNAPGPAP